MRALSLSDQHLADEWRPDDGLHDEDDNVLEAEPDEEPDGAMDPGKLSSRADATAVPLA